MLYTENIDLVRLVLHGMRAEQGLHTSDKTVQLSGDVLAILKDYFLNPFKSDEYYHINPDPEQDNEVYTIAQSIFNDNQEDNFVTRSVKLAERLHRITGDDQRVKPGELYIAYFSYCNIDGEELDAIGIFKSENRERFLKVYPTNQSYDISYEDGININKLDKGCLIFNTESDLGYLVTVVDNVRKSQEASYWKEAFLSLIPRNDPYHQTTSCMQMCKEYITDRLPEKFDIAPNDKAELLNRTAQYFKQNEAFNSQEFTDIVLGDAPEEVVQEFRDFKQEFQTEQNVEIEDDFTISQPATKKQNKLFKSVIKLDKNFHIYIHGDNQLIEKGYDEARKMPYYQIFFNQES